MRVSDKMNHRQVLRSLNKNREQLADFQNQSATMKRVTRPSEDPVAATRVLEARTNVNSIEQFLKNSDQVKNFLDFSERSLEELSDLMIRVKEIALSQANSGTTSPEGRAAIAMEIKEIYEQANQIANRKIGDRFVFGGFSTMKRPFEDGNYYGDNGEMEIEINNGTYVAMNLDGREIFYGKELISSPFDINRTDLDRVLRGPASVHVQSHSVSLSDPYGRGVDVFRAIENLENSLNANDTRGIQNSIDLIDIGINQVVMSRAKIGARLNLVNKNLETLQKNLLDNKILISKFEDADAYEVYSEMHRAEGNLKASLSSSGKLVQTSLLDFLR